LSPTHGLNEKVNQFLSGSGGSFFTLKDHNESATVRILSAHPEAQDLPFQVVHVVANPDNRVMTRNLVCPETSSCPFCQAGLRPVFRGFIPLLNYDSDDENKVRIFQRPVRVVQELILLAGRIGPLVNRKMLITRIGKKGDTQTRYVFTPLEKDDVQLSACPDLPNLASLGAYMIVPEDKMKVYLEHPEAMFASSNDGQVPRTEVRKRPQNDSSNVF
jgi:hypothetical protein